MLDSRFRGNDRRAVAGASLVNWAGKAHCLVIPPSRSPADLAAYRGPRKTFPMADKTAARTRAETHFSASEARDQLVKTELAKERIAFEDRTIKLKAMRLARDAEEATEKARLAALAPPKAAKKPAKPRAKKPLA